MIQAKICRKNLKITQIFILLYPSKKYIGEKTEIIEYKSIPIQCNVRVTWPVSRLI